MAGALLYGAPAPGLIEVPPGAQQLSPLIPGSVDIAALPDASADSMTILAPPGTLERDFVLAHALRRPFIPPTYRPETYLPWPIPGTGPTFFFI